MKVLLLKEIKVQGKTFKKGTVLSLNHKSNNEKENNVFVVCGKNGKEKSLMNPSNHVGINNAQLKFALENNTLEIINA